MVCATLCSTAGFMAGASWSPGCSCEADGGCLPSPVTGSRPLLQPAPRPALTLQVFVGLCWRLIHWAIQVAQIKNNLLEKEKGRRGGCIFGWDCSEIYLRWSPMNSCIFTTEGMAYFFRVRNEQMEVQRRNFPGWLHHQSHSAVKLPSGMLFYIQSSRGFR